MKHGSHLKDEPKGAQSAKPETAQHSGANHGEGNPEAAANFNKAEQEFVVSKRGQQKIREAGNVRPEEEPTLKAVERITRSPPISSAPKATPPKDGQR
jgi:hypothetical protein